MVDGKRGGFVGIGLSVVGTVAAVSTGTEDRSAGAGEFPAPVGPAPVIRLVSTAGVAPLTVHVHAVDSEPGAGTPLTARYEWDFGDPNGRYNKLEGFVAAHTYDEPGTYTLTLRITDELGFWGQAEQTIDVLCDDRPALYVAAWGDDDNPGTSPDAPLQTAAKGFDRLEDHMRLLFRRGHVFDVSGSLLLEDSGVLIGAYGTGDPPALRWLGEMGYSGIIKVYKDDQFDIVIQDLAFDSIHDVSQHPDVVDAIVPAGRNITIRDCLFGAVSQAVNANRQPQGLMVMDNEAGIIGKYLCWAQGTDHCYLGNTVAGSHWEHNIRLGGADRVLIAHNSLTNHPKRTIWVMLGQYCYIGSNELHAGRVSIGPDPCSGGPESCFRWAVMARNRLWKDSAADPCVELLAGAEHVSIRNNIIQAEAMACVGINGFDPQTQRTNKEIHIVNNTGINSCPIGRFLDVGKGGENFTLSNNLYAAPNLTTGVDRTANVYVEADDLSAFDAVHHNVWAEPADFVWVPDAYHYVYPYWSDAEGYKTPQQWGEYGEVSTEAYEIADLDPDFTPRDGTIAATHGVPEPGVFTDFYGAWRPPGNRSAGAVEANPVGSGLYADVNGDGVVNIYDLFAVLAAWGGCPDPPEPCPADINEDGVVDFDDVLLVLNNWS
ncbi:MAG: PKD domain-containing protein [Phycisphaerales bacterium]|nr:MAG: PKD domain-containing protein [Phycisphaerales bacterium]